MAQDTVTNLAEVIAEVNALDEKIDGEVSRIDDEIGEVNDNLANSLSSNGLTAPIEFGYDAENDVYGYIKAGADTVTPFSGNLLADAKIEIIFTSKGRYSTILELDISKCRTVSLTAKNLTLNTGRATTMYVTLDGETVKVYTNNTTETYTIENNTASIIAIMVDTPNGANVQCKYSYSIAAV